MSWVIGLQTFAASALSGTQGILVVVALAVAVLALLGCAALAVSLRRLRRTSGWSSVDRSHATSWRTAAEMQSAFRTLQDYVTDVAGRLEGRLAEVESSLEVAISHRALVRYDAYNELSGPSIDVDRAARRKPLGHRALVHPPP